MFAKHSTDADAQQVPSYARPEKRSRMGISRLVQRPVPSTWRPPGTKTRSKRKNSGLLKT